MNTLYVFGYGSLMSPSSISGTLERAIYRQTMPPVRLKGYTRAWSYWADVFVDHCEGVRRVAFLNIEKQPAALMNGLLVEVTHAELRKLGEREKNYDLIKLDSDAITPLGEEPLKPLEIHTFTANPSHTAKGDEPDILIAEKYLRIVHDALSLQNFAFRRLYEESTRRFRYGVVPGDYRFNHF